MGESSRSTTVLSASKISFSLSLSCLRRAGGVAVRLDFLADLCFDFLENMPAVQVWYFLRLCDEGRSGAVLGRARVSFGTVISCETDSKGSSRSSLGVGVGVDSLPYVDQKCFFFRGGLPLVDSIGELEADNGLFGIESKFSSLVGSIADNNNEASAVFGRRLNIDSPLGMLIESLDSVDIEWPGLAIELILFDNECPRMVELLLSVSEDIIDNGRGITWTFSEKSTVRGR